MGAIAGLVFADQGRVAADSLPAAELVRALANRNGQKPDIWTAGSALLCRIDSLATLRPHGDPAPGMPKLGIVADARLDDRDSLARALGADAAQMSDAELIASAYAKWDIGCAEHLTGDFAFAIWDPRKGHLFCCRDQLGVRPFYYRNDRQSIMFASRINALSRQDDRLDKGRIASYLAGFDDSDSETAFAAIRRLPPAHCMLWTFGAIRLWRYWSATAEAVPTDEDFALGFRRRFLRSVEDRLRGTPRIGAMLSGGLDSSSIVSAVARSHAADADFRLQTFSFSYPDGSAFDERLYVEAVRSAYPLDASFVSMDEVSPFGELAGLIDGMDDLFFAPGLPKMGRVLAQARQSGVGIMLDGHGGDEVASHGFGRLTELAKAGQWLSLYRELRGVSGLYGDSPLHLLAQYFLSHGVSPRIRRRLMRPKSGGQTDAEPRDLIDAAFGTESELGPRMDAWQQSYREASAHEQTLHAWNVSSPTVARSFEALARAADRADVELRFPFYDRRLVSYALALPESEKLRDGWSRSVLRRAMQGILPEAVRWRRTKIQFGPELADGLVRHHSGLLTACFADGAAIGEYIDLPVARALVSRLLAQPHATSGQDLFAIWRAVFLALWLADRPVALERQRALP